MDLTGGTWHTALTCPLFPFCGLLRGSAGISQSAFAQTLVTWHTCKYARLVTCCTEKYILVLIAIVGCFLGFIAEIEKLRACAMSTFSGNT